MPHATMPRRIRRAPAALASLAGMLAALAIGAGTAEAAAPALRDAGTVASVSEGLDGASVSEGLDGASVSEGLDGASVS
ncbi:hypothetical protein ABT297_34685, partial [Dactylosporangium sp. NPDC000555]|uniref:hypothetical protein n=1 Tax=Dactylosporangium sp. NPDC000555 TaxID=3154260 RepID=UPI003319ADE6